MEGEQRLFEGAVEAVIVGAHYTLGQGWQLRLQLRRQYEDWADARVELYELLTTSELIDVLEVTLGQVVVALGG